MRIRIIGVPSAWGTRELGARRTPSLLRRAGLLDWLSAPGVVVVDSGDVDVPEQTADDVWRPRGDRLEHVSQVVAMATAVRGAVDAALDAGDLPLVVGGECCCSIGIAAALDEHAGPVTVAWLDAHGDINTPETSASGLITGMPFAVVLGRGDAKLLAVGAGSARPRPEDSWLLGGRDLDAGEVANVADLKIHHLTTERVRAEGPEAIAMLILGMPEVAIMPPEARAMAAAAGEPAALPAEPLRPDVYLHFDVDSLDPVHAPGVHYRVDGGFHPTDVGAIAGHLCASGRIGAIAVASANLDHDEEDRTVGSIREVLTSMADALAAVESGP